MTYLFCFSVLCNYYIIIHHLKASTKREGVIELTAERRNEQYKAYKSGEEEPKTVTNIIVVERYIKNLIYPKIKFLSDTEEDYNQPDFAGDGKRKQSVSICNKILSSLGRFDYTIKQKVLWWVSYRKVIKSKLSRLRQADVRSLHSQFEEGQ